MSRFAFRLASSCKFCNSNVKSDLTNDDIAWCEVHAHRVLDAVEKRTFEIEVVKCAVQICDHCIEKENKRVFQELDRELMRNAANESMLRQKRQCIIQKATSQWLPQRRAEKMDAHDWDAGCKTAATHNPRLQFETAVIELDGGEGNAPHSTYRPSFCGKKNHYL